MIRSTTTTAAGVALLALTSVAQTPNQFSEQSASTGLQRIHRPTMVTNLCAGGAVADFNRDGFQDIFYAAGGTDPDALWINNGDGTFTDRAAAWGIALAHRSTGATPGDFNGDGWIDLFVTSHGSPETERRGAHKLYRNDGGRGFTDVSRAMGVRFTGTEPDGWGASFGDYDGDGDLDLAVPGYRPPYANHLFRNDGDVFTDVTAAAGLREPLRDAYGFTVKFVDMDGDLDQDLLWVSDFGTGRYFRNDGDGTFTDLTEFSGTMLEDTEMGVTINDFNEDGLLDFWVTTVVENGFYINRGNHRFDEIAQQAGVRDSGWGWGAVSFDWDHDTRVDMIGTSWEGNHYSFYNTSPTPDELRFREVHELIGLSLNNSGRGLSNLDYDNDGDQDLAVFTWFTDFRIFRNDLVHGPSTNWLRVALDNGCSSTVPPDGVGAIVRATVDGRTHTRLLDAASNYLSNSEFTVHFGLGSATTVDELRVEWPDGLVTTLTDVATNQFLSVRHPPDHACFKPVGAGCAAGSSWPRLTPRFGRVPAIGSEFFFDASELPPSAPNASLLLSFDEPDDHLGFDLNRVGIPGCRLFAIGSATVAVPATTLAGYANWHIEIPNDPALDGLEFFAQAAVVEQDAATGTSRLGLTNAYYGVCK